MKDVYRNYLDATDRMQRVKDIKLDTIPFDHCIAPLTRKIKAYEIRLASHHLFKSAQEAEEPNEEYFDEETVLELEDGLREMYIKLERYYA